MAEPVCVKPVGIIEKIVEGEVVNNDRVLPRHGEGTAKLLRRAKRAQERTGDVFDAVVKGSAKDEAVGKVGCEGTRPDIRV